MYAKCGLPTKALEVFKKLPTPDITSWNSLIRAYVNDAQDGEALNCFRKMQLKGVTSDAITLVYSLRASASLCAIDMGITIHVEVARKGFLPKDIVIGNAIIDLYAKCGFVERAHEVLDSLPNQTVVSWTTLIAEYVRLDLAEDALDCFQQMQDNRLSANSVTFACCLKACGLLEEVETGRSLHSDLETNGLIEDDLSIGNEVIGMYARCGFFMDARNVLYRISIRDVLSWNALLVGYVLHHHDIGALKCFQEMQIDGVYPNDLTLALALKISGNVGNMDSGKGLHDMIVKMGLFENDQFICNSLVDTYARLGMFEEAWNIFHMLPIQDVAAWASLIEGYTNHNHPEEALCCFEQMMGEGVSPSTSILMYTLKVCGSVKDVNRGISIHSEIARTNLAKEDLGLGNALVSMYTQCGSLIKAQEVFDKLSARNVATWNALITAYANQNEGQIALDYFSKMQQEGFIPNAVTFVCALNACADCGVVGKMIDIHCEIARRGFVNANEAIGNALTNTYAQCGLLEKAQEVLANMLGRGLIAWTALIGGYTKAELDEEGLVFYEQMKVEGFLPNAVTYISILKACGNQGNQYQGRQIHTQIALQGLLMSDPSVGNALVKMYAKCGCFTVAREALNNLPFRDSASWNALIMEYSSCGLSEDVLSSFEQMQLEGVHPNAVTFACSLQACACMGTSEKGQTIHTQILNMGDVIGVDSMVCNSLLYMYVRCGSIPKAMELIEHENHNAATWCQLVARCIKHVLNENMHDFGQTMIKEPVSDFVDLFSVLDNLCYDGHSDFQHIYTDIGASNLLLKSLSTLSAICDVSSKRELFSKRVYNRYTSKNVVVWTALMTDLIKHGQIEDALNCYDRMQLEGIVLDSTAFVHCLIACGNIGALQKGCEIHAEISRMGLLGRDLVVGNALVNMYSKCGSLQTAQDVFDQLSGDVITWTSLIDGHVQCGDMNKAFSIFEKMRREGTNPDAVIFLKILDACSRANLLDKAQLYFDVMQNQYGVSPSIEHYTCILDLLGRAGNMQELEAAMKKMPLQPDHVVWRTVLGAYKRYGQSNLGGNAPQFSLLQGVGKDGSGCL
ncbi:hypothetical protein KP509_1Z148400 [Ceratopteris richardii]|nr:hypothetical protein KP509_1Z148400 [Ceratopteris richardii]